MKLTNNPEGKRTDPTSGNAVLTISGNYYNGSFGAAENTLEIQYGIAVSGEEVGSYMVVPTEDISLDGDTYSVQIPLSGLDYESAFDVVVIVSDQLEIVEKTAVINKGIPIANWGKNNFTFNVPLFFGEKGYGSILPEEGKKGQVFFLLNSDGTYSVYIHNGTSWA